MLSHYEQPIAANVPGPGPLADRDRVDGVQHYGRKNPPDEHGKATWTAVPRLYVEMVAEDRRLRLARYEIYGFGGYELSAPGGRQLLEKFFTELLTRHQKPTR
ncbi:hypothetical protein [Streptomyces sp. DT171]|uniref:hypothetical protein n=1 Tax=Streptomyces sp. DT171 TaxID=3416524 RepID=UPI003CF40B2D